jgi:hypothetical protein
MFDEDGRHRPDVREYVAELVENVVARILDRRDSPRLQEVLADQFAQVAQLGFELRDGGGLVRGEGRGTALLLKCAKQFPELGQSEFEFAPMNCRLVRKNVSVPEHLGQDRQFLGASHLL